jgi:hypothetical protein
MICQVHNVIMIIDMHGPMFYSHSIVFEYRIKALYIKLLPFVLVIFKDIRSLSAYVSI